MCKFVFLVALCFSPALASAQGVSVADSMSLTSNAGEAQSTIVPPGKKTECKPGRFLVTDDSLRPPQGVVSGRNLNQTASTPIASTFNMGALAANFSTDVTASKYFFGTNDHDLVTLSNGDVLYITGAFSRMPLAPPGGRPMPIWMSSLLKQTFRAGICTQRDTNGNCIKTHDFGPNARSVVLVFRSTDCGATFNFISEMDPMRFEGGTCGLPQFRAGTNENPYDMGGTDGQLIKVDPANDRIYLTFQCVGYNADDTSKPAPLLDPNKKINKTLVLLSDTAGASWKSLGLINQAAWRFGVIPLPNDVLAFGFSSSILTGKKNASGTYDFDSTGVPAPVGKFAWMGQWNFGAGNTFPDVPLSKNHGNVFGVPVVARTRDAKSVVLAFPDNFGSKGLGYRIFFYDRATKKLAAATSILPTKAGNANIAFHLAVADPGSGPVLLYWTDLDSSAKTMTIRGRVITGKGEFTDDFTVSRANGADRSFALPAAYWIGDYHTAGAHLRKLAIDVANTTRYDFYPMWVEANGTVRYTRVEYAVKSDLLTKSPLAKVQELILRAVPPEEWKPEPPPVALSRIARPSRPAAMRERDVRQQSRPRP